MDLASKYHDSSPWPARGKQQVLFILDIRNSFEQELLRGWIHQHTPSGSEEFQAPQVCLNLGHDRKGMDSAQLVMALALPADTLITPLRVAWLPSPKAINSGPRLRDFVFGDPRHPGTHRGRKILSQRPERVHLIAGVPDSVANLRTRFERRHSVEDEKAQQDFASFVARQAVVVLDLAERRLQGGRYKVPRHVAASLKTNTAYNEAVDEIAAETGASKAELMKEAAGYMDEMVSRPSTFWLDFYAKFNKFCLGLGYEEEIVYDQAAVEKMRQIVRENPSMLLWTHKTYLDGMVVPKVLYDNDFPMPHMFGGANMNFPGLGFLLHRAGGIFIKRSFRDNELYKITLRHYIGYLMEKRFPMNWAFEGTRSRIGKLMPPRYGLLKYVLEACNATDARNIHIIPISISYDLIRDVEEYATEQTGRSKGAESLRWFIGYIRSLARPMGKVYMDIGEPVVLERAPEPNDRLALSKIAFEVAVEANHVTPITFPSLVTMSLLGSSPRALTEDEVMDDITALLAWAEARKLRISKDLDMAHTDQMRGVLDIMIDEGIVTRYDEGLEIVYGIDLDQHPVASYYRNTVIHFFVNKAIIELAVLKASENEGPGALEVFWSEVDHLRDLFKFEFFYAPTEEFHQQIREELDRYDENWETLLAQGAVGFGSLLNSMIPLVSHITLLTFAEAYSVVAALAARLAPSESLEENACVNDALKQGRQAYLQRRISSESSIGKLLFKNGFKMLQSRNLTDCSDPNVADNRRELARELRDLLRRINLIRAIGVTSRGTLQEK
ncbi:MAG: glycerol-3-phosphate 1-O-acyltransferase [Gammaproteobacteria bacterium]|nr:MAG: glycerol-3-phosphate 1-O-acyltransferase [Gammaproteobacteria bacterium]